MTTTAATKTKSTATPNTKGTSVRTATTAPVKDLRKVATKGEQARLTELVQAVKVGIQSLNTTDKDVDSKLSLLEQAALTQGNARVATSRALAALAKHPETFAKSGPTKGQPALNTIATLVGSPRTTLMPLWKGAQALTEKKWERRTVAPTAGERELVGSFFKELSTTRVSQNQAKGDKPAKGKGSKPGTKALTLKANTLEDVVAAFDMAHKVAEMFAKNHGLTESQLAGLATKLDLIHDVLETATATKAAADSE